MKKITTTLAIVILAISTFAQSPEKFGYQAVIRDADNSLVIDQAIGMQISILQGSSSGAEVYVETQAPTTNENGLANIEIGQGDVFSGDFSLIDWANGPYFLKTEIDPEGGSTYTITATNQLLSVPYALFAKEAGNVPDVSGFISSEEDPNFTAWSKDYSDLTNSPDSISDFVLSANSNKITNMADPTEAQDAATKAYVDGLEDKVTLMEDILIDAGMFKVKDIDGNVYNTVKIGDQVWTKENLKTTRFSNGDTIPTSEPSDLDVSQLEYIVYQWPHGEVDVYGRFYTFYVANDERNVCPKGWHVPSKNEWITLIEYVGGADIAGEKLKSDTAYNYENATNEYDFSVLPAGNRSIYGSFWPVGAKFWTSTEGLSWASPYIPFSSNKDTNYNSSIDESNGFSIRCVKD